jgi:hypothetical protein
VSVMCCCLWQFWLCGPLVRVARVGRFVCVFEAGSGVRCVALTSCRYNISRADCDAYALRSQTAWGAAHAAGVFDAEIESMSVGDHASLCVDLNLDMQARPLLAVGHV